MSITVFRAEKEAGLEELIKSSAAIALCGDANIVDASDNFSHSKAYYNAIAENKNQVDLFYLKTVLVSTGWNRNDDVFDPVEMWKAKATPEDKPFNYEHDCKDIIGHITGCYAVDKAGNMLPDNLQESKIPDNYDIITSAVLYKIIDNKEKQDRINKIIEEIGKGQWYVSMEALFRGFDYALESSKGGVRVIERNENTAFLTKSLKAYGGNGKFENQRIGRVFRNIVFSGKGLVRKPANPDSVILSSTASSGYDLLTQETNKMPEEPKVDNTAAELAAAKERADKAEADLKAAQAAIAKFESEKKVAERTSAIAAKLEAEADDATALASALKDLSDEAFNSVVATAEAYLSKKLAAYKAKASEKASFDEVKAAIAELKAELLKSKADSDNENDETTPDDETTEAGIKKPAGVSPKKSVKKIPFKAGSVPPQAAPIVTGSEALDNAKPNEEPALSVPATASEDDGDNDLVKEIASYLGVVDDEAQPKENK